jgi:hypothetical protein
MQAKRGVRLTILGVRSTAHAIGEEGIQPVDVATNDVGMVVDDESGERLAGAAPRFPRHPVRLSRNATADPSPRLPHACSRMRGAPSTRVLRMTGL